MFLWAAALVKLHAPDERSSPSTSCVSCKRNTLVSYALTVQVTFGHEVSSVKVIILPTDWAVKYNA